jgi:hypothetical protein
MKPAQTQAHPHSHPNMKPAMPSAFRTVLLAVSLLVGGALALAPTSIATPTPPAPKPPRVYTGDTPEVSTSSATVRGAVDPRGVETNFYVQYGTTAAYGAQTQPAAVGSSTQEIKVVQTISGLQSNATYHYRIVASSSAGTTFGEDRTFTTRKIPLALKIVATPHPDVFGSPFSISGTLSGSENANHAIVLQANPFPYLSGFKDVESVEITDSAGDFSFTYSGLSQNTEFRVAALGASPTLLTPSVLSAGLIELVAVRATIHLHHIARAGFVRLDGSVEPASPDAYVAFQWLRPGHKPQGVGRATLKRVNSKLSRYSAVVHIPHNGLYRAFVQVLSGRQVSHYSRSIRID